MPQACPDERWYRTFLEIVKHQPSNYIVNIDDRAISRNLRILTLPLICKPEVSVFKPWRAVDLL